VKECKKAKKKTPMIREHHIMRLWLASKEEPGEEEQKFAGVRCEETDSTIVELYLHDGMNATTWQIKKKPPKRKIEKE
jgi:hypothetical protein